jgi:LmbE family N-acetylglucosaminyl deacetylase
VFGNKILILAPHTDDGELGCGGTISRLIREGKDVDYCAFSTARESVPEGLPPNILEIEVKEATKRLGIPAEHLFVYGFTVRKLNYVRQEILEELVKLKRDIDPDTVFLPSISDLHQDHHTVAQEGRRAFKDRSIFSYELPWNNIEFRNQCFIRLTRQDIENKVYAVGAYESQQHRRYTDHDYLMSWAITRGVSIGEVFAECFEVVRLVL